MATPEQAKANREALIIAVRYQLGLQDTRPSDWTYDQRVNYNKTFARYITENPQAFTAGELQVAKDIAHRPLDALDDTSFVGNLSLFGDELLNQAAAINQDINPFSEKNRRVMYWLVVAGLAIYVLGPTVVGLVKQAKAKA